MRKRAWRDQLPVSSLIETNTPFGNWAWVRNQHGTRSRSCLLGQWCFVVFHFDQWETRNKNQSISCMRVRPSERCVGATKSPRYRFPYRAEISMGDVVVVASRIGENRVSGRKTRGGRRGDVDRLVRTPRIARRHRVEGACTHPSPPEPPRGPPGPPWPLARETPLRFPCSLPSELELGHRAAKG